MCSLVGPCNDYAVLATSHKTNSVSNDSRKRIALIQKDEKRINRFVRIMFSDSSNNRDHHVM